MIGDLHLILFDVDGTLVDSQGDIVGAMTVAFTMVGHPVPGRDAILSSVGLSLAETMRDLAPGVSSEVQDILVAAYKESYANLRQAAGSRESSPLYPNTRAVLETLHAMPEYLLGVATGKSRRGLNMLVDAHDLKPLLVTQQCADDHPSKPHPSMLEAALRETGVPAHRAIMVGDSSYDMQMARAAGVTPVGVSWGYQPASRLQDAATIIDDIRDLPALVQQIWSTVS